MSTVALRRPGPALAPFVSSIGYHEGEIPHAREVALPSGTMALYVNLDRDALHSDGHRHSGAAMHGPFARPSLIETADQRRIVWVTFRVGGAYPFIGPGSAALRDQLVDLAELWGRDGAVLRERLLSARDPLDTLETLLVRRAGGGLDPDRAVGAAAVALHRGHPVADVADRLGWTTRRLARRFADQVGLTPKRFARVRRFQRLLRAVNRAEVVDWGAFAADHGFHDQAHLIHEFRAHAGMTPTSYTPRAPGEANHVAL
jgi:AraC-like DNA-binding protein